MAEEDREDCCTAPECRFHPFLDTAYMPYISSHEPTACPLPQVVANALSMRSPPNATRKRPNLRAKVRAEAAVMLHDRPEGMRFTDLVDALNRNHPSRTAKAIGNDIVGLDRALPTQVFKPSKGLYMHCRFRPDDRTASAQEVAKAGATARRGVAPLPEHVFYSSFANWLRDDLEEVTQVIVLGGNTFRDRWGTPDVLGKFESRRSDVVKGMTLIVASEVKADVADLLKGFGQACAYRLFAHKSYLVIPQHTPTDELDRLEALCRMHGVGLVTFDARNSARPSYRLLVRPIKHEPDLSYTNKYVRLVERKLFA